MVIDSHMHIVKRNCWDKQAWESNGLTIPSEDIPIETIVMWFKKAGISRAVAMGQDMSRIWNTLIADEDYVFEVCRQYPDFFIHLASAEPINKYGRYNKPGFDYLKKEITDYEVRGVLFTPPYGQYNSNDKTIYPFYELCQDAGIVVQFHHSAVTGAAILAPTKYANPYNLNDVIIDFPDMKVIVEHLGYPFCEHLFVLMANHQNLWSDLAQLFDRPTWLTWNLVIAKEYGVIDRIMYASDFVSRNRYPFSDKPDDEMKKYFRFIRTGLNNICMKSGWPTFTEEEIDGILWKNVARLYNIVT